MAVYVNNLYINCGETFSQKLTILDNTGNPVNLTGYAASSYVRKHSESSVVSAAFAVSFTNIPSGVVELSLSSSTTSSLKEGRYVYDVLLINGGSKSIVLEGFVLVRSGITT